MSSARLALSNCAERDEIGLDEGRPGGSRGGVQAAFARMHQLGGVWIGG